MSVCRCRAELSLIDGFNAESYCFWALGAGCSSLWWHARDETGWLTPDRAAEDLATVLDWVAERAGEDIQVWGWSYGSMIGQHTAHRFPKHFRSLSLFGYPVNPDTEYGDRPGMTEPERRNNTAAAAASDFIVPGSLSEQAVAVYVREAPAADPLQKQRYH